MKPKLEKIPFNNLSSITVKREITPYMDYPWHYHPEFEIIFVEKSYGIRLMGSHIGNFSDGDLVFISPGLPHVWKNDKAFYQGNKDLFVDVYVIHFRKDAFTEGFFNLPEFTQVRKLFLLGQQGILIHEGEEHRNISTMVKQVVSTNGLSRLILFLKLLDTIAGAKNYELLSIAGYKTSVDLSDTERINTVMNFIMANYSDDIKASQIARLINLTETSFCRYFKSKTHKTFSHFLNEVRILNACKLLVNSNMTVTQICYNTGYNNISHFNRQFKLITGLTAKQYARKYTEESY